jgi:hypothetical protein
LRLITPIWLGAIALYAAPQATVNVDELPVHSRSSAKSSVVGSLKRGDSVTVGLVLSASDGSWCEITYPGPPPLSGVVPCGQLNQEPVPEQPSRFLSSPSNGAVARADTDAAIAEAIRLSGIGQAIAQLGDPSVYLAAMPTKQLTPQQAAEVRALVMQSMRPERFQQAVTASLKNTYPADAYPQLLEVLRSPLARRMTAIETQQSHPDPKALQAFVAGLNQTPPDAQHLAIVRRIDQVTRSSQLMVDMVAAVLEGMAAGSGQISAEETRKMVDEVRGQRGDTLRQAGLIHLLFEYRGVPNDQLSEYASTLASPLAIRFSEAAERGLLEATRQASAELMRAMMQRFPVKVPPVGKN